MAYSSGTRNLLRLAATWTFTLTFGAVVFLHGDSLRELLGLKLAPGDAAARVSPESAAAPSSGDQSVRIRAGSNGHFQTTAHINGRSIEVMVDTGASMVALTWEDARAAGIFLSDSDFKHRVSTANGVARVAAVTLDSVSIDDITVRDVRAAVAERGKLETTLLGMTFLGKLGRAEMSRGVLVLQQ